MRWFTCEYRALTDASSVTISLSLFLLSCSFYRTCHSNSLLRPSFARPLTFVYSKGSDFFLLLLASLFFFFSSLFLSPPFRNRGRWWTNRVNRAPINRRTRFEIRRATKDGFHGREEGKKRDLPFPSTLDGKEFLIPIKAAVPLCKYTLIQGWVIEHPS